MKTCLCIGSLTLAFVDGDVRACSWKNWRVRGNSGQIGRSGRSGAFQAWRSLENTGAACVAASVPRKTVKTANKRIMKTKSERRRAGSQRSSQLISLGRMSLLESCLQLSHACRRLVREPRSSLQRMAMSIDRPYWRND